ncbi:hypothetical protein QR680_004498 [Steinernema hermaphroditum]|uniref:Uncharacterized protein n=1 Tax=Steinernema hermaphroditum TaxID=289476 RepID=A0AA39LU36_9BILA|nr:hypothetical protein QR680_004498 [Steinernema hermaphroditum]
MSATAQMAAMLNELMGVGRNAEIAAFCPHELFVNTKADLGQCKLGEQPIRTSGDDMKRKIARHEERLALTQTAITPDDPAYSKLQEQIATLDHDIENLQKEASEAGAAGEIRKAQEFIERSDRLQQERAKLKANLFSGEPGRGKTMEVCQICGCFMNVGETQQRLDEHLNGRQHVGYAKVNATIEELKERLEKIKEKEDEQRQQEEGKNRGRSERGDRSERFSRYDRDRYDDRHRDRKRHRSRSRSRSGCRSDRRRGDNGQKYRRIDHRR